MSHLSCLRLTLQTGSSFLTCFASFFSKLLSGLFSFVGFRHLFEQRSFSGNPAFLRPLLDDVDLPSPICRSQCSWIVKRGVFARAHAYVATPVTDRYILQSREARTGKMNRQERMRFLISWREDCHWNVSRSAKDFGSGDLRCCGPFLGEGSKWQGNSFCYCMLL